MDVAAHDCHLFSVYSYLLANAWPRLLKKITVPDHSIRTKNCEVTIYSMGGQNRKLQFNKQTSDQSFDQRFII